MSIYVVLVPEARYLTLVVRAGTDAEAREIGARTAAHYLDHTPAVEVEYVDPNGPAGVIVEDPS